MASLRELLLLAAISATRSFALGSSAAHALRRTHVTMAASNSAASFAETRAKRLAEKRSLAIERDAEKQARQMTKVGNAFLARLDDKAAYDNAGYLVAEKKANELRQLARTAPPAYDKAATKAYDKEYAAILARYAARSTFEIIKAAPDPDECAIDDVNCQLRAVAATQSIERVSKVVEAKKPMVVKKVSKDEAEENASVLYLTLTVTTIAAGIGVVQRKLAAAALAAQAAGGSQNTLAIALSVLAISGVALTLFGSDSAAPVAEATTAGPLKANADVGVVKPTAVTAPVQNKPATEAGAVTPAAAAGPTEEQKAANTV